MKKKQPEQTSRWEQQDCICCSGTGKHGGKGTVKCPACYATGKVWETIKQEPQLEQEHSNAKNDNKVQQQKAGRTGRNVSKRS